MKLYLHRNASNDKVLVPFNYLHPASKEQRLKNMKRTITTLGKQLKSKCDQKNALIELEEAQSEDMVKLVHAISESEVGCTELQRIYEEAETVNPGKGVALQNSWDNAMFFADQERNGKNVY